MSKTFEVAGERMPALGAFFPAFFFVFVLFFFLFVLIVIVSDDFYPAKTSK